MSLIDRIKRDREAGTPGPWGWEVSLVSQLVELCGGKGGTDLTVMSFARWGMQKAAPVFWKWHGNMADEPQRADKIAEPVMGREHHADWFRRIDHPDARRIAAVPDMEAALLAAEELYRATKFLADNDPDDVVCDGGGTAILVGLSGIRKSLAAYREATR